MSEEIKSKSQAKKAARDAERRKKGKNRQTKNDQLDLENGSTPIDDPSVASQKNTTDMSSGNKKRKRDDDVQEIEPTFSKDTEAKKTKSSPKKQKKSHVEGVENGAESTAPTKSRFIVFVGNLPYSATDEAIQSHFKALSPFTLRHRTDPASKKSKGFAFLEFENYDRMKTCLKSYHHSLFEEGRDSRGREKEGRRINVELTAGGGGKAEGRKEKIRVKNERLEDQRKRRMELERKEKLKKESKKADKAQGDEAHHNKQQAGAKTNSGIHPSRMARIQG